MRAYVFTDSALARHAGRFVWLALDNEKPQNASFSKRVGIRALPTYFVIDPATEKVALRWVGGATVAQLERVLKDGRLAVERSAGQRAGAAGPQGRPGAGRADRLLARADSLYGTAENAAAAAA